MRIPGRLRAWLKHRQIVRFYGGFVRPGELCFDVGANVGERTEALLRVGARVVAVEPQSSCFARLEARFAGRPGLRLLRAALGSEPTEARLWLCDETTECATLSRDFVDVYGALSGLHWGTQERVPVTTLDELCLEHGQPVFCKLDVEGFESEVLRGLSRPLALISFEFNRPLLPDTRKSLERLCALGSYECNLVRFEQMRLALPAWLPAPALLGRLPELIGPELLTGEIVARLTPGAG